MLIQSLWLEITSTNLKRISATHCNSDGNKTETYKKTEPRNRY